MREREIRSVLTLRQVLSPEEFTVITEIIISSNIVFFRALVENICLRNETVASKGGCYPTAPFVVV